MEVRERAVGAITVLDPVGRLVLDEGDSDSMLKDAIISHMRQGGRQFVFDLAHVSQVDTSGLAALMAAYLTVVRRGGQMKLLNPTKRLRELLGITKLDVLFEVFDTEQDAAESFAKK
jgi:anti-anti-sigma factor